MNWTFELLGLFLLLLLALLTAAQLVRQVGEALLEPLVGDSIEKFQLEFRLGISLQFWL